jgi:hypothetical protein
MPSNYVSAKAKVLRTIIQNAEGHTYELGFKCPDCESGWIKMEYVTKDLLADNSLIDVKIGKIIRDGKSITKIEQYIEPGPEADWMPAVMILARNLGIVEEPAVETPKKDEDDEEEKKKKKMESQQYTIIQVIQTTGDFKMYKIKENDTQKLFIGLSTNEFAADTLAGPNDFAHITPETQMADFTLIHHWWGNGEQYEHYDLFINTDPQTHIVFGKNPLKETDFKAVQRKPYTEDFWQKGQTLEQIAPGQPGNPSKTMTCSIERVDSGKVAVYENAAQPNGDWAARMEFFGTKLEGRWSLASTTPNVWSVLKETTKLTDNFPLSLHLSGDIGAFKETPEGLIVEGKALSFGVWNGMYWSPEVIKNSPVGDFDNMLIDVEHQNSKVAGKILEKKLEGTDINVKFLVNDYEVAEKIKSGEYKGLSIDAIVFGDPVRRVITGVKKYNRLTVCANPACKVCYFNSGLGQNCAT